jgi:hypothetical protein
VAAGFITRAANRPVLDNGPRGTLRAMLSDTTGYRIDG